MHKELIAKAFSKAKLELGTEKVTRLSTHLSDYICENSGDVYGERRLRDYYNQISREPEKSIDLKGYVAEALSHYLGYDCYSTYLKKNCHEASPGKNLYVSTRRLMAKHRITLVTGLLIATTYFGFTRHNRQRWMAWHNDHYIEVRFDPELYNLEKLKVFNADQIERFRKVQVDCQTIFFSASGSVSLWYGKNGQGQLEWFTDMGYHPETGKPLKPITTYMIRKYICPDY